MKNPLLGHYERLRTELAAAYEQPEWSGPHIDRLANEIAALERRIAAGSGGAAGEANSGPESRPG